jgi:hypothetical protein
MDCEGLSYRSSDGVVSSTVAKPHHYERAFPRIWVVPSELSDIRQQFGWIGDSRFSRIRERLVRHRDVPYGWENWPFRFCAPRADPGKKNLFRLLHVLTN